VAVKVIRPGIEKRIRKDIQLMYYFAARFERSFDLGRIVGAVNLVKEFERTIFRELDMLIEAGNIERFTPAASTTSRRSISPRCIGISRPNRCW
jgi:ubiquinone biosynthesis protein